MSNFPSLHISENNWTVIDSHDCSNNNLASIMATNMDDCMSRCYDITGCVAVVFVDYRTGINCYLKSACTPTAISDDGIHIAMLGNVPLHLCLTFNT